MKFFDFKYRCAVQKVGDSIRLLEYNSPYNSNQDKQSREDIFEALLVQNVFNFKEVKDGEKKNIEFTCRFIENRDGTYDQIFIGP